MLEVTNILIIWSEPEARGEPIDYYIVEILSNDGIFVQHPTYCNQIVTNSCLIPMQALVSEASDLKLTLASLI